MSSATLFAAFRNHLFLWRLFLLALWGLYPTFAEAVQKALTCRIVTPTKNLQVQMGQKVAFAGRVVLRDKEAKPLKYEWDFGGGAQRLHARKGKTVFERDNARYRVRFTVTDAKGRYCEDAVQVTVGAPPHGLPPKVAERPAPKRGEALQKNLAVLPFEEFGMQGAPEALFSANTIYPYAPHRNVDAQVIQKGSVGNSKPKILGKGDIQLRYSAGSNPRDPVGSDSINSTSQNWPPRSRLSDAIVPKTDWWELYVRPNDPVPKAPDYVSVSAASYFSWDEGKNIINVLRRDEGAWSSTMGMRRGVYMPGIRQPFETNEPQLFPRYVSKHRWFDSPLLPITDIDDRGRVNPYPLLRIEAVDKATGRVRAATDQVVTAAQDMKCRECHAKGEIAADPSIAYTKAAWLSSYTGKLGAGGHGGHGGHQEFAPPKFYDATGTSIAEREYAAYKNLGSIHDFYDGVAVVNWMDNGELNEQGQRVFDGPWPCAWHHGSNQFYEVKKTKFWWGEGTNGHIYPNFSKAMHRWHGRLQVDGNGKLLREKSGKPLFWDVSKGKNPNSLFPTGKGTTMEDNCLKCHAGKREQCYRDRMYTAGVQCADCHGDMLAVAQVFPKSRRSADGNKYRQSYFDQPDCGSCHTGIGGEPVLKTAFDPRDPSATPLRPKTERFAIPESQFSYVRQDFDAKDKFYPTKININTRLYRWGKDTHGKVACAACHGSSHAIWPNRDPKANDNVTALQLQGHTGSVSECSVCHTKDAFKRGQVDKNGDGILAGPHGMHPVNDPSWYAGATDSSGKFIPGGWHGKYIWRPGKDGGEQCSACHGADHKGTRLAKVPVDREYRDHTGKLRGRLKAGEQVTCALCHTLEVSFGGRY